MKIKMSFVNPLMLQFFSHNETLHLRLLHSSDYCDRDKVAITIYIEKQNFKILKLKGWTLVKC